MSTVRRVMAAAIRVVSSRAFSVSALICVCAVIATFISLNLSVFTTADGENSKVMFSLHNDQYRADGASQENVSADEDAAAAESSAYQADSSSGILNVQITADDVTTMFTMLEGTVADAIAESGVQVGQYDKVTAEGQSIGTDTPINNGLHITVVRIQYREYTKTQSIPFETDIIYTNTLAKGKTQMRHNGTKGVKTLTYRECIEDGKVIDTELVSEKVTTAPVNASKLVGVVPGTPISPAPFDIPLDESGQPVNYTKKFTGKATAYTSDRGDSGTVTSYAGKARVGVVAIDPKKIPYGSKLYIVSEDGSYVYGYAIAGDTGGGVRSGKTLVDLFYDTYEECIRFGRRTMNLYIIE